MAVICWECVDETDGDPQAKHHEARQLVAKWQVEVGLENRVRSTVSSGLAQDLYVLSERSPLLIGQSDFMTVPGRASVTCIRRGTHASYGGLPL